MQNALTAAQAAAYDRDLAMRLLAARDATETVPQAYARFLSPIPWQVFATLTYRPDPKRGLLHHESARKRFERWIDGINRHIYGDDHRKRRAPGVCFVVGDELQQRGVWHHHAMLWDMHDLRDPRTILLRDLWHEWFSDHGIAKIEIIRSQAAVTGYCAKYALKEGDIEWSSNLGAYLKLMGD